MPVSVPATSLRALPPGLAKMCLHRPPTGPAGGPGDGTLVSAPSVPAGGAILLRPRPALPATDLNLKNKPQPEMSPTLMRP